MKSNKKSSPHVKMSLDFGQNSLAILMSHSSDLRHSVDTRHRSSGLPRYSVSPHTLLSSVCIRKFTQKTTVTHRSCRHTYTQAIRSLQRNSLALTLSPLLRASLISTPYALPGSYYDRSPWLKTLMSFLLSGFHNFPLRCAMPTSRRLRTSSSRTVGCEISSSLGGTFAPSKVPSRSTRISLAA